MGKKRSKVASKHLTRATVLYPDDWPGWPTEWGTSWNGQTVVNERVAIVYACVERVANALASMDLHVSKDGQPTDETPTWLINPNELVYTHVGDAITEIVWSLLMRGNAYLFATALGANDYPLAWVVLNPDIVSWEPRDASDVDGWRVDGQRQPADRIVHIRHMNRPGQRLGLSPLDAAAGNLLAVADYERLGGKLARTSGIPTQGILTTDQDITETVAQRYKARWQARGDGDVAVLGSGLKYESLTLNPRDLALLELREFDGRAVATVFGVPPFMVNLGMAGDLTYSTTQGMMDFFWRQTLRPMATNIGRALGTMLPNNARTVVFDADEFTRGTQTEHMTMLVAATGRPILDVNEARASIGLAPLSLPDQPPVPVMS